LRRRRRKKIMIDSFPVFSSNDNAKFNARPIWQQSPTAFLNRRPSLLLMYHHHLLLRPAPAITIELSEPART
jgi:hypothetical protein